jgi:hypothetical protein
LANYVPAAITPQALSVEEAKLRRVEESIRLFVRVADPNSRQIVPMRYFNLMLSTPEIEAYTADYLEETGRRADAARMMLRTVALVGRITTEIEELKRSMNSLSVWKLHADSLAVLVELSKRLEESSHRFGFAGDNEAATDSNGESIGASLKRLRERTAQAAKLIG